MKKILQYQTWHLLYLILLLIGIYYFTKADKTLLQGQALGVSTNTWLLISILSPILHQTYVVITWRLELYYNSLSKNLGKYSFKIFKIGFGLLILSRIITIIMLAYSNRNSLEISTELAYTISGILLIPASYLFYSVKKYFGMNRAFGIDHFQSAKTAIQPFVKKGIFKYTANGMYIYGFLILYIPGLLLFSKAAILIALFNHLFIWAHYFFTEKPDIKVIYGE